MIQGKHMTVTISAGQDLQTFQYYAVNLAGLLADTPDEAIGVLQSKPNSGEHGTLGFAGHMKAKAGGAVNSGALVTVTDSGFFVAFSAVASGSTATRVVPVGKALTSASSGALFDGLFNFPLAGSI